jgi:hypothetical protein
MYQVQVSTDNGKSYASNLMQFDTYKLAYDYAINLMDRWLAVTDYKVIDLTTNSEVKS